jgi:hypothetical protein
VKSLRWHRLAGMRPESRGYRAICECGWESGPGSRTETRGFMHDHLNPTVTLTELVAEHNAIWREMQRRLDDQRTYREDCAVFVAGLRDEAREAA